MAETNIGAIVRLSPPEAGSNIWKATQTDVAHNLPPVHDGRRKDISWMFGPVVVTGYVDTDYLEIGVTVTVAGINVGALYGNLKDSVELKIDLFVVNGEIQFYLKNGNEIWIHLDLKVKFDGHYEGDYKILSI